MLCKNSKTLSTTINFQFHREKNKMFELQLYQNQDNPLEMQLHRLIIKLFGDKIDAVAYNNIFFLSDRNCTKTIINVIDQNDQVQPLTMNEYLALPDQGLESLQLMLCKIHGPKTTASTQPLSDKFLQFQCGLINWQVQWLKEYTNFIKHFLTRRYIEKKSLIQFDAIRILWADLIERQKTLTILTENFLHRIDQSETSKTYLLTTKSIRESCEILAKFGGGRAFLQGQAIEALWLFGIINRCFLTRGNNNEP